MTVRRKRVNFVEGTLGAALAAGATTITFDSPPPFTTLEANHAVTLTLGEGAQREVVYLTAFTAGASTGTVRRGMEGTNDIEHAAGTPYVHAPTARDFGPSVDEGQGHGLGATSFPPPWSVQSWGLVAGADATAEDGYDSYTVLGPGAAMVLGPNNWQDGVVIGYNAKGSGEAIVIGPRVTSYQSASVFISDYPTGETSQGDVAIGAYLDVGVFDTPPNPVAKPTSAGTSKTSNDPDSHEDVGTYLKAVGTRILVMGANSWAVSDTIYTSLMPGETLTRSVNLNNAVADITRAYIQIIPRWDVDQDGQLSQGQDVWVEVPVADPLSYKVTGHEVERPEGPTDSDYEYGWAKWPPLPYYSKGVDTARVLIGYSGIVTDDALECAAVGPYVHARHERAILLGSRLVSQRPYETKVGSSSHTLVAPGAVEFRTVTATAAHTIDGDGAGSTPKETVVLADATAGAFDVTLPAPYSGRTVIIKKIDASGNAVGVVTPGAETIDGAASDSLAAQYDVVRLVCDDNNWFKV